MLQAMPGKVVVRKIKEETTIKGIYFNGNHFYYIIENIAENDLDLHVGDKVIIKAEAVYSVAHENQELGIVDITDILAKIK